MAAIPHLIIPSRQHKSPVRGAVYEASDDKQVVLDAARRKLTSSLAECSSHHQGVDSFQELFGLLDLNRIEPTSTNNVVRSLSPQHEHKKFKRLEQHISSDAPLESVYTDDLVPSLSFSVSALLSFVHLRTALQLARDGAVHPAIVQVLSHPSTTHRLARFKSDQFSDHLKWSWLDQTSKKADTSNFSTHQIEILRLVQLSPDSISNAVGQVSQCLRIGWLPSLDILLSFVFRRRLAGSKAIPLNNDTPSSDSLLSLLHLNISHEDISLIDWASSATRYELISVFIDEFAAFLDCISILSSFTDLEPPSVSIDSNQISSRTQRFYVSSAVRQGKTNSVQSLQHLALYVLRESFDFATARRCLWDGYVALSTADSSLLDGRSSSVMQEKENSTFEDITLIQLKAIIKFQTSIISCLTSVVRYKPEQINKSDIHSMAEFIVERSFLGVLGDLLIRQENRTMMILISQSPSLTPIIRDLTIASSLFVVSLHELHYRNISDHKFHQTPNSSEVHKFHDVFVQCLSRLDGPPAPCLNVDLQPLTRMAVDVALLAHSVLCLRFCYENPNSEATASPRSTRKFANSLFPERLERASAAFHDLQMFPKPSPVSDELQETPISSIHWHQPNGCLPTLQSLKLNGSTSTLNCTSGPYCSSGALRVVLFDLIESVLLSVNLSLTTSVDALLTVAADLCQMEECIAERVVPINDEDLSFWRIVVIEYLLNFIPYSLPLLLHVLYSILPKRVDTSSSERRFASVMSLLTNPISKICFPPLSSHIIPLRNDSLSSCNHRNSASSTDSIGHRNSGVSSIQEEKWDWEHYVLTTQLSLEKVFNNLLGIPFATDAQLSQGLVGRLVGMPVQLPSSIFLFKTPAAALDNNAEVPLPINRRYRGCAWAMHSFTSHQDVAQTVMRPIDPVEFKQFDEVFDAFIHRHSMTGRSSGTTSGALVPNPFKCNSEDPEGMQRWFAYKSSCLAPGNRSPFTLEWSLIDEKGTPSILDICWGLWDGLLATPQDWNTLQDESELILRINFLVSLTKLFGELLNLHACFRPALERSLSSSYSITSTSFQRQMIRAIVVGIHILKDRSHIVTSSSIRLLILESTNGLLATLKALTLQDVYAVLSPEDGLAAAMWSRWCDDQSDETGKDLEKLGHSPHTIYSSWFLRLCLTSSTPLLEGVMTAADILNSLTILLQPGRHRCLTMSMLNSILAVATHCLLESPMTSWGLTAIQDALIASERNFSAVHLLTNSQPGGKQWNVVKDYVAQVKDEIHQIYNFLSLPPLVHGALTSQDYSDLSLLNNFIKFIFGIVWVEATSAASNWDVKEKLFLLNALLPVLNILSSNFSAMNSRRLDVEAVRSSPSVESEPIEIWEYREEVRRFRFLQNILLQSFSEYDVVTEIFNLIICDGKFRVSDDRISLGVSHGVLTQAHIQDIINPVITGFTTVGISHSVFHHALKFTINILSVTSYPNASQLFDKLRASLSPLIWSSTGLSTRGSSLLFASGGSVQLSTPDPFESLDRRLILDLNFERSQCCLNMDLNFTFSLVSLISNWSGLFVVDSMVLMGLLLTKGKDDPKSNVPKLLSQIHIKLPPGLIGHLCGGTDESKPESSLSEVMRGTTTSIETSIRSIVMKSLISNPATLPLKLGGAHFIPSGYLQLLGFQSIVLSNHLCGSDPSLLDDLTSLMSLIGSSLAQTILKLECNSDPTKSTLTHQDLTLAQHALQLLIQLLKSNDAKFINRLGNPWPVIQRGKSEEIESLSFWTLLRRFFENIIRLWDALELTRYDSVPSRLPTSDLFYSESTLGHISVPSGVFQSFISPTRNVFGFLKGDVMDHIDCSFSSLPLTVLCSNLIIQIVLDQIRATASKLSKEEQTNRFCSEEGKKLLSRFPKNSSKSVVESESVVPSPLDCHDFKILYELITMSDMTAQLLFLPKGDRTSVLPSLLLLSELESQLEINLQEMGLTDFLKGESPDDHNIHPSTMRHLTSLMELIFGLHVKKSERHYYCPIISLEPEIFDRKTCHQFSFTYIHCRFGDFTEARDIDATMNKWISLLELLSLTSVELSLFKLKHQILLNFILLLSSSRTAKIFPIIFRPSSIDTPDSNLTELSIYKKPFQCYTIPVLKLLLLCYRDRNEIWNSKSNDFMLSFGGALIDFSTGLLTANWEADCRACVPSRCPNNISSLPDEQHRTSTEDDLSDSSSSRKGSSYEEGVKTIGWQSEWFPQIFMYNKSSSGCLSSTWQSECQSRPQIRHPEGVWLLYPICQLITSIPSIDIIETLKHENESLLTPRVSTSVGEIKLLEELVAQSWEKCNATIREDENRLSSLSDLCRCVTFLHISIRIWIATSTSINQDRLGAIILSILDCFENSISASSGTWNAELKNILNLFFPNCSREVSSTQIFSLLLSSLITAILQSSLSRSISQIDDGQLLSLLLRSFGAEINKLPKLINRISYHCLPDSILARDQLEKIEDRNISYTPLLSSRPLRITTLDLSTLISFQSTLALLSLINEVSRSPAVASLLSRQRPAQLFARMPGPDRFALPLRLPTDPSKHSKDLQHQWRPTYEQLFQPFFSNQTIRAHGHLGWCRVLLCLIVIHRNSDDSKMIIEAVIQFQERINFVFTATKQTAQLALLEEMSIAVLLLAQLPPLQNILSIEDKAVLFRLSLTGLKAVQQFAHLTLGRGQIEMAEIFKPTSTKELQAAGVEEDGESVHVPSIFHQRIIVLTIKILSDFLRCFYNLSITELTGADLCVIAGEVFRSQYDDLLEDVLHDIIDIGRLILQLLEDLLKLERQVFIGVVTQSSGVILPLSLSLRCEDVITRHSDDHLIRMKSPNSIPKLNLNDITDNQQQVDTPPPTPKFTSIPSDAQTVISRRPSPLIQRYASGTPIRSSRLNRIGSPIMKFSKLSRIHFGFGDRDLEGCLPEIIQFSSLIKILQNSVEAALLIGTQIFGRLVADYKQMNRVFDRPSVIRRLTEFFTAVQGCSVLECFKGREQLFKKMVTVIGWSIGDDVIPDMF